MPYRHYGKWRARWVDETGEQRSRTFDDRKTAAYHEQKMKAEVAEILRGLRSPTPPTRTFAQLADRWMTTRALAKRSKKDDESILNRHSLALYVLNGTVFLLGLIAHPMRTMRAFRIGRAHRTLYRDPITYEELLGLSVGSLRARLGVPDEGLAEYPPGRNASAARVTRIATR